MEILIKLEKIINQESIGENNFLNILKLEIGIKQTDKLKSLIFHHAHILNFDNGGVLLKLKDIVYEHFILYYPDVLPVSINYQSLIDFYFNKHNSKLLGVIVASNFYQLDTGYIQCHLDNITGFIEKPNRDEKFKNMAIGIFNSKIIEHIEKPEENFYRDLIPRILKKDFILKMYNHDNKWYHFQHINKLHYEHVLNYSNWLDK